MSGKIDLDPHCDPSLRMRAHGPLQPMEDAAYLLNRGSRRLWRVAALLVLIGLGLLVAAVTLALLAAPAQAAGLIDCDKPCDIASLEPDASASADAAAAAVLDIKAGPMARPVFEVPPFTISPAIDAQPLAIVEPASNRWLAAVGIAGACALLCDFGGTPARPGGAAELPGSARAIPEPATWALLLLGFGAIGAAARGRRPARARRAARPNGRPSSCEESQAGGCPRPAPEGAQER